jgi:1,4-alpha-glucan branching enzyme
VHKGYLAFVLHAHLPYVRHPEHDNFLEERWFFEAVTETYIPLIKFFDRLINENVLFRLTVSVSPSLLSMMEDKLLQERYAEHLTNLIELSEKEVERTRREPHVNYLAGMYRDHFTEARQIFMGQYGGKLSSALKRFHESGVVELITTSATHSVLPLLAPHPKAVTVQIATGLDYFRRIFGFDAPGIWLPECGYCRGLEEVLRDRGIRYFIVESHGIEHAGTTPFYGVYAPLYTPSGVAAFGRDRGSTKQVWSAREGFPGDPVYREFYRDIGHDLGFNYIQPYVAGHVRTDTGIKYHRITGPTLWKELYHPDAAREKAAQHAGDFLHQRISHITHLSSMMETAPVVVAPFDAELFGHWWFEGLSGLILSYVKPPSIRIR